MRRTSKARAFKRFSVAHELGHYFLDGHPEAVLANGFHQSQGGFGSRNRHEQEADIFAACLLMPREHVRALLRRTSCRGLAAIEELADLAKVSLSAAAFRYAELADEAVAVFLSRPDAILGARYSEPMKNLGRLDFFKDVPPPSASLTARFSSEVDRIAAGDRDEEEIDVAVWFSVPSRRAQESVVGLGTYGRTLTVLTCATPLTSDEPDDDEEKSLIESWTPRFRR